MFPFFLKRTTDVLGPLHLGVVFRRLRLRSFISCWRQANDTLIQKGPPSSSVAYYQPIYIISVLPKVFEGMVSVRLGRLICSSLLTINQFAYCKGLCLCGALFVCHIYCKMHLRVGKRRELCRLTSASSLIVSTIREFSKLRSAGIWDLCCLCWHL